MRSSLAGGLLAVLVAVASADVPSPAALPALERVYVNPSPVDIPDFTLTDQTGAARAFSSLRGEPVLVFFGFTHCSSACPITMARLRTLHAARDGKLRQARIVMVSVDGDRDTPATMRAYLEPLSPDFIGLTGDPKATARIAATFAAVFFKEPAGRDGSYNVMHSTQIFAVDKAGRLRASFADASIEDMATVTALLLAEPG